MTIPCKDFLTSWRGALIVVMAGSAAALIGALIAQYGFALKPCVLCLWQRVPYVLCLSAALAGQLPVLRRWRGALLLLCGLLLLIDGGIAFFHTGVEQHWWHGTSGCSLNLNAAAESDPASLTAALLATPTARCDEIPFTFLGLSMAAWNILYAGALGLYALYAALAGRPDGEKA